MSIYMAMRLSGDPDRLREYMQQHTEVWQQINERAKQHGALHHRFMADGEGTILVTDEWESREGFERFFAASPEIRDVMQAAGVTSEPQISFWEALDTPDAF